MRNKGLPPVVFVYYEYTLLGSELGYQSVRRLYTDKRRLDKYLLSGWGLSLRSGEIYENGVRAIFYIEYNISNNNSDNAINILSRQNKT